MLEQHSSPVTDAGSAHVADLTGSARSADELRILREQLAERTRQLEASEERFMDAAELAQRRADILAVYAHDLRSPLAAIIGYSDLLTMGVPATIPDCAQDCVGRIREAALHLQQLLDQLLTGQRASGLRPG